MLAAVAALLMTACGGKEATYQYKTEYLPVQLVGSEKWSILDVTSAAKKDSTLSWTVSARDTVIPLKTSSALLDIMKAEREGAARRECFSSTTNARFRRKKNLQNS